MPPDIVPEDVAREVGALTTELFGEDDLGTVLRVHLRIENVLDQVIQALLPSPDHLQLSGGRAIRYELKVSLASALGVLVDLAPSLRAFGALRNDFAHQPNMKLDHQRVTKLYDSLGAVDRDQVLRTFENMKREHEQLRGVARFKELPSGDQFKVITISVWTSVRTALEQAKEHGPLRLAGDGRAA